jgi:paraquat-inducible protein B
MNIRFDEVQGLNQESRVVFDKKNAGTVETVHSNPNGTYSVRVSIDKEYRDTVTEYTQFRLMNDPEKPDRKAVQMVVLQTGGKKLPDGASVTGVSPGTDLGTRVQQEMEEGFEYFKKQIDEFTRELKKVPESDEYRRLKRSLAELADEISRAGKQTGKKLKERWLPRIERELEELKKQLREQGREEETQPLQEEMERIRKI